MEETTIFCLNEQFAKLVKFSHQKLYAPMPIVSN